MTDTTQHMDRAIPTSRFGGERDHQRSEREFARARRHTRLVSMLKIGLPLTALLIVVGGIAVTWLARGLPENATVSAASLDDGRIVMEDPRMSGVDNKDRPYSMIAQRAIQSLDGGGIELESVRANVSVSDTATADIVAARGHYDPEGQKLRLYDDISVDTTDGMSMTLSEARIDLATGGLTGAGPVAIETPSQTIEAGSLTVRDGGRTLSFGDRVKMTLTPSAAGGIEPAPSESDRAP